MQFTSSTNLNPCHCVHFLQRQPLHLSHLYNIYVYMWLSVWGVVSVWVYICMRLCVCMGFYACRCMYACECICGNVFGVVYVCISGDICVGECVWGCIRVYVWVFIWDEEIEVCRKDQFREKNLYCLKTKNYFSLRMFEPCM